MLKPSTGGVAVIPYLPGGIPRADWQCLIALQQKAHLILLQVRKMHGNLQSYVQVVTNDDHGGMMEVNLISTQNQPV